MFSFSEWMKNKMKFEYFGGNAGNPSGVDEENPEKFYTATGGGAFPTFGDDLPITKRNKKNLSGSRYAKYAKKK